MYIDSSVFLCNHEFDNKFNCFYFDGKTPSVFNCNRKELSEKLVENEYVLVEPTFLKSHDKQNELSYEYKGAYFYGVGNMPHYSNDYTLSFLDRFELTWLYSNENIIIGDIGIKFSTNKGYLNNQKRLFVNVLKHLKSFKRKTIFIEIREMLTDSCDISTYMLKNIDKFLDSDINIVLVNYYGSINMVKEFLNRGYYFLITPQIIDNNTLGEYYKNLVKNVPIENIMTSSYSPIFSLSDDFIEYAGCNKENYKESLSSPFVLPFVIKKISEIKNLPLDYTRETINKNTIKALALEITKYIDFSTKEKLSFFIEDALMNILKDNDFVMSLFPIEYNNSNCYVILKDSYFYKCDEIYYLLLPKDKNISELSFAVKLFGEEMSLMKPISKEQFFKAFINHELKKISLDEEFPDYYPFLLSKLRQKLEHYNFRERHRLYCDTDEIDINKIPEIPAIPD